MDLHHSVVDLEVLLTRIDRGELDAGWSGTPRWDRRRQQRLVDTVVRNWPMPAILVAEGDERDVLLDGRERLRALWRFSCDELPFAGRTTPVGEYLEQLDGFCYTELPARFRRRVQRYGVPVVRVTGQSDGEALELMARWDPSEPQFPATRSAAAAGGAHRPPSTSEPIYDELSAWFRDLTGSPSHADHADQAAAAASAWSSPADPGHDAAHAALHGPAGGVTAAGLPIREPAAHLVPGAIDAPSPDGPPRAHDARAVGENLTRFRDGTAAARGDLPPPG